MRPPLHWLLHRLRLAAPHSQVMPDELACVLRHARGARRAVEIGVYHGVTTAHLRTVVAPEGEVLGIDPHPPGRLGVSFERWIAEREIGRRTGGHVRLVQGLGAEVGRTSRDPVDFLFVDGDHSWEGIAGDWLAWRPRIAQGGKVALHDSRPVAGEPALPSVAYTAQHIVTDPAFTVVDAVRSVTVLQRNANPLSDVSR